VTPDELKKLVHQNTKNLAYFKDMVKSVKNLAYFKDMVKSVKRNAGHLIARTVCDVCETKGKSYVFDIDPDSPFVGKTKSSRRMVACPECLEKATE
jgi:hypothetical protein